jgi:histidyl-tRNA synthetase
MENFTPDNAKGTKDFYGEEAILRNQIKDNLRIIFERYGFLPLETPILEKLDLLTFKGGDEISKEIFQLTDQGKRNLGIRFDQTVPMTRYVAMNAQTLKLPFKRYEIGPVFRDGPTQIEKGRYRVFTQCDVDVVGVASMSAEAEILALARDVFQSLNLGEVSICINNRKLLEGVMDCAKVPKEMRLKTIATIDKRDKIGLEGVALDLATSSENGSLFDYTTLVESVRTLSSNDETLGHAADFAAISEQGKEGLAEIKQVLEFAKALDIPFVQFEPSLARGLTYYTGTTFEVFLKDKNVFSSAITAGGRYDKMIGSYLNEQREFPAVGISFGLERIVQVMQGKNQNTRKSVVDLYVIPIGNTQSQSFEIANGFRQIGLNVDMDLLSRNPKKNIQYADSQGIPYVCFVGPKELSEGIIKVKNMTTGEEKSYDKRYLRAVKLDMKH